MLAIKRETMPFSNNLDETENAMLSETSQLQACMIASTSSNQNTQIFVTKANNIMNWFI